MSAIQYGQALERLIWEVLIADPELRPMHILKLDISDGFYSIFLLPIDDPNLGLVFTSKGEDTEILVLPLTLPMWWKNLPPTFCISTDTVADLANAALH